MDRAATNRGTEFVHQRAPVPQELARKGVTRREAQVLELLAGELTNGEVADELVVSVRTVESHVSSLLTKLNVPDRRSLARLGRRQPTGRHRLPQPLAVLNHRGAFVGRQREIDRLLRAFDDVAGSRRRFLIAVTGEPGAGKTRLVAELAARIRGDVWFGRCDRYAAPPYEPFLQASQDLSDLLLEPVASETDRYRLFEAVDHLLSEHQPLLLVIDDLHWADEATLTLLRHLIRHSDRSALLIAVTLRHESDLAPRIRSLLVDMRREQLLDQLPVPHLDRGAAAALVRDRTGDAIDPTYREAIVDRAGGNPFFLHELAEHAARGESVQTVPFSVLDAVRHRLTQLSDQATAALRLAAVAGQSFTVHMLFPETQAREGSTLLNRLEEGVRLRFLVDLGAGRFEFSHAIVRDALYRTISPSQRAALHLQVARKIEELRDEELLGSLAHHLREAGKASAKVALAAADHMARRFAHEQAASFYAMAREALPADDVTRRGELLIREGESLTRAGSSGAARRRFHEAAQLARQTGSEDLLARAALGVAGCGSLWSVDEPLIALLREALDGLNDSDRHLESELLAALAQASYYTAPAAERIRLTNSAVKRARTAGSDRTLGRVLRARHLALWGPDGLEERIETAAQMVELGRRTNDLELEAVAEGFRFVDLLEAGDLTAAEEAGEEHDCLAVQLCQPVRMRDTAAWKAMRAMMKGRFEDAADAMEKARTIGRRAGNPDAEEIYRVQRIWLTLETSRAEDLHEIARWARREADARPMVPAWRAMLILIELRRGNIQEAHAHLDRMLTGGLDSIPRDYVWTNCLSGLCEICFDLQAVDLAREVAQLLNPYRNRLTLVDRALCVRGSICRPLGMAEAAAGDMQAARKSLKAALLKHQELGADALVARTVQDLARVLENDDPDAAARYASRALELPPTRFMPDVALHAERILQASGTGSTRK